MKHTARAIVGLTAAGLAAMLGMGSASAAAGNYEISSRTCDVEDAGTDSRVEVRLNGTTTSTGWIVLDNPGDDRERGHTDVYAKTLPDVGFVTSVDIYFANNDDSPHWCLEEFTVRTPNGVTSIHPFHNWLTRVYSKNAPLRLNRA
ncbi:PLAT/LH2 domain-containing protein [Lentzea sp. NPDC051838]|uniref:PLAT/LH2 domain-containing protein n=1 Tax=Lentzea sp. NPDC051838 TaxID=3154849 RepID=UPI003448B101